jgi:hypothetical protein
MSRFEYRHDEHGVHRVTHGELMDVVSEIGAMLQVIHNGLTSQSQDAADVFRAAIRAVVTEDSPVWQEMEHHEGETMIAMVTEQDKE